MKIQRSLTEAIFDDGDEEDTVEANASSPRHYSTGDLRRSRLDRQERTLMYTWALRIHERAYGFATFEKMVECKLAYIIKWLENVNEYYPHPLGDFLL